MNTVTTAPAASQRLRWRPSAALQVAHTPTENRRLAATLLAAISALTLLLGLAGPASAATNPDPETAVAAQTQPATPFVGADTAGSSVFVGVQGLAGYDGVLGCCVAPTSAADDVALGLRGSGDVGGVANRNWIGAGLADEGPFVQRFYQAMYRSTSDGGRIRFNLDGLDLNRALSTNRFSDPFDVGATNWELQQILANPQFRGATDFYFDGQILSADRVASLGLGG